MSRARPLPAITLILLSVALLAPVARARVLVAWLCEGRICGTSVSACCCKAATGQDANCSPDAAPAPRRAAAENADPGAAALCQTSCSCEMVIAAAPETSPATITAVSPHDLQPALATLYTDRGMPAPATELREIVHAPAGARGPPCPSGISDRLSPRAPPAL